MKTAILVLFVLAGAILCATDYEWDTAWNVGSEGGNDIAYQSIADDAGNIYVTGTYTGTAQFGTQTLAPFSTSLTETDIFLAKYDSSGFCQWAIRCGSNWWDHAFGLTVDSMGNIIIAGTVSGYGPSPSNPAQYFGSYATWLGYGYNAFAAKFSPMGEFIWLCTAGPGNDARFPVVVNSIAADAYGELYATGYYYGSVAFGSTTLTAEGSSYGAFVAKISSSGGWMWATEMDLPGNDSGTSICVDATGVYVCGSTNGAGTHNGAPVPSYGYTDMFIGKLSVDGYWQWTRFYGSTGYDSAQHICTDGAGFGYVSGNLEQNISFGSFSLAPPATYLLQNGWVLGLDPDGNPLWGRVFSSSVINAAGGIDVLAGQVFVNGVFNTSTTLAPLPPVTGAGLFFARLATDGTPLALESVAHASPSVPKGLDASAVGIIHCGSFAGSLAFGSPPLSSHGGNDAYVAIQAAMSPEIIVTIAQLGSELLAVEWEPVPDVLFYRVYSAPTPDGPWTGAADIAAGTTVYHINTPSEAQLFLKVTAFMP